MLRQSNHGTNLAALVRRGSVADNRTAMIHLTRLHPNLCRRAGSLAVLLLFVFGSEYCVVTAFATPAPGRTGVRCHAMPAANAARAGAACCRERMAGHPPARPAARHDSPCCMALATVSGPQLERHELATSLSFEEPAPLLPLPASAVPASRAVHREHRAGPLAAPAGAPLALRAPPLV